MRALPLLLLAAALLASGAPVRAQEAYSHERLAYLEPGTRLRVTTSGSRETGDLASVDTDRFDLKVGGVVRDFRYSDVRLVEVSRGRRRGSQALTIGLGLAGLAAGIAVAATEDCYDYECTYRWLVIPPLFATGGLVLGWGLGQAIVTERWLPLAAGQPPEEHLSARASGLTLSFNLKL